VSPAPDHAAPAVFPAEIRRSELRPRVGDLRQIASIRRFHLADGAEAGMEMLAVSTGGGLDFWVSVGRMMDIATLAWQGRQIAWQSPAGFCRPRSGGAERAFSQGFGGFLNTCGFDHVRQPAGGRPLHGSAPFTPATLLAHGADWDRDEPLLHCEGEAVIWCHGEGGYRLRRRIEAPVGGAIIRLRDRVEVIGPEPLPILALYHFNLGYPLHDRGSVITLDGAVIAGPLPRHEAAPAPAHLHAVRGERALCSVAGGGGIGVAFRWPAQSLPWLQLWRDLRPSAGVVSIEPCSVGRDTSGANEAVPPVAPGGEATFDVEIEVIGVWPG
jgi:hypothetical protein